MHLKLWCYKVENGTWLWDKQLSPELDKYSAWTVLCWQAEEMELHKDALIFPLWREDSG